MVKIGILAPQNHKEITNTFLDIFKKNHIIAAIKNNSWDIKKNIAFIEDSGIEYAVIVFKKEIIYPIDLDILIIDNMPNKALISYSLIECVKDRTFLIYNTDNGYLPKLDHENAIDYGFSPSSSVTVSSIEYLPHTKSFILSVQRPLKNIYGEEITICELPVININNYDISSQLPAVITSLICNIPICNKFKSIIKF